MKKLPKKLSINKHTISRLHNVSNIFGRGVDINNTNTVDPASLQNFTIHDKTCKDCPPNTDDNPRQSSLACVEGMMAK